VVPPDAADVSTVTCPISIAVLLAVGVPATNAELTPIARFIVLCVWWVFAESVTIPFQVFPVWAVTMNVLDALAPELNVIEPVTL
jgi:hypothetical protein